MLRHCTVHHVDGNGIMMYGTSLSSTLSNNHIHHVGMNGIQIIPKQHFRMNSFGLPVFSRLLLSINNTISYNRIHTFGQELTQSIGLRLKGSSTLLEGNLIHTVPLAGVPQLIENAGKFNLYKIYLY